MYKNFVFKDQQAKTIKVKSIFYLALLYLVSSFGAPARNANELYFGTVNAYRKLASRK